MKRRALIITYTMSRPAVVGVFFRALRLAAELRDRDWRVAIVNRGPIPKDVKVDRLQPEVSIASLPHFQAREEVSGAHRLLSKTRPHVVVFGEGPFDTMERLFQAAHRLRAPLVLLDQDYGLFPPAPRPLLDRVLLYSLRALWEAGETPRRPANVQLMPPFIAEPLPRDRLPAPSRFKGKRWVTLLGLDETVLQQGVRLAATLDPEVAVIVLGGAPDRAERCFDDHGLGRERALALGSQEDPVLFGFIASSEAVILANGFMQITEALALGCPAVCVDRGVGLEAWTLDRRFLPYVSIGAPTDEAAAVLRGWTRRSPFSAKLQARLRRERNGVRVCADAIEDVVRSARAWPARVRRFRRRWASYFPSAALRS